MTWPGFPKRLQSALKALCCLAQAGTEMQAAVIAEKIGVPKAETAKILQLLVWGGFVTSRRGTKGGFQLADLPERITIGKVIDFFVSRHPDESDRNSPVVQALQSCLAPGQQKFDSLTLAKIIKFPGARSSEKRAPLTPRTPRGQAPKNAQFANSQIHDKESKSCF
jgi:Rrf2 family protein